MKRHGNTALFRPAHKQNMRKRSVNLWVKTSRTIVAPSTGRFRDTTVNHGTSKNRTSTRTPQNRDHKPVLRAICVETQMGLRGCGVTPPIHPFFGNIATSHSVHDMKSREVDATNTLSTLYMHTTSLSKNTIIQCTLATAQRENVVNG